MYQVARAVHFLHSGGANGHAVFHRDIKPANIVLTRDYTAKLIDCGLSTFVRDGPNKRVGSVTNCISSSNGVCGTAGYVCPEFTRRMGLQPYSAACDIFSLGVVLVELICGQVQSPKVDYFQMYVDDEANLTEAADSTLDWQSNILDSLCKVALKCMSPKQKSRPSSKELTTQLSNLADICFRDQSNLSTDSCEIKGGVIDNGTHCILCNCASTAGIHCNQKHWTCLNCLNKDIIRQMGHNGSGVHCTVQGCTCSAYDDKNLYGKIDQDIYDLYINTRDRQKNNERHFAIITNILLQSDAAITSKLDSLHLKHDALHQSSSLIMQNLAYLETEEMKKCPTLVWLEPSNPTNQRNWTIPRTKKSYKLHFICEKSFQVIEPALEIRLSREWVVKIAPILRFGLFLLQTAANSQGISFPFPFRLNITTMEGMVDSLLDEDTQKILDEANSSSFCNSPKRKVFVLMRTAYEMISEIANQPTNTYWKEQLAPMVLENRKLIWVKKEFLPYQCGTKK
jgi:serine/threonine protein kinase